MALMLNRQSLDSLLPNGVYLLISAVPINVAFMGMSWRRRHHSISESAGRNRDDILTPKYLYELERDYTWLTVMLRVRVGLF